ncbi:hypothetical protein BSL78_22110 [Apostichopus japonicus]|uniref:Uncharacterized protein n=2 Tax=Stichopus japonicus TaxID=307972 RepID=A0A2G8JZ46_STIJA|nr:hypothetical protein BSL78_22110 [Apostichopus japonicus]
MNINKDVAGTVLALRTSLEEKDDELAQQQKITEKLKKDLEILKNRLSMEAIARRQAETENELLQEQLQSLRHRLGSM